MIKITASFFFCLILGIINPYLSIIPVTLVTIYYGYKSQYTELFLFFLLVLIFADNRASLEAGMKMNRIIGIVLITFFTLTSKYFKSSPFLKNIKWLIPFWICLLISWFFSPAEIKIQSFLRTISYGLLPLTAFGLFIPFFQEQPKRIKEIINLSIVVIIMGFLLYLIAPQYVQSVGEDNQLRISGLLGNANGLAIFSTFFSIIAWFAYKKLGMYTRNEYILLFLLFLMSILISGSRTSLVVFILFHGLTYINTRKGINRFMLKYFIIPIFILSFTSVGISYIKESSVLSSRARLETLETLGGRLIGWQWGYQQVSKALWFGKGLMYDSSVYQISFSQEMRSIQRGLNAAYSGALALLLDTGAIGAFFFIIFFIGLFKQFKDKKLILPVLAGFILSFIFESWIMASLQPFTILFYTIIGLFQFSIESKA
jgi:hypothetical protein